MGSDRISEGKGAAGGPFAEALESASLCWRGGAALPRLLPAGGSGAETDFNTLGSEGVETTGPRGVDCSCTTGGMRVLLSFMLSRWNGGCCLLMWVLVSYKGGARESQLRGGRWGAQESSSQEGFRCRCGVVSELCDDVLVPDVIVGGLTQPL